MHLIIAPHPIHRRLTINSQIPQLIHARQLVLNDARLARRRLTRPGQLGEVAPTETGKEGGDVVEGGGVAPEGLGVGGLSVSDQN